MYLSRWNLAQPPFGPQPDSRFLLVTPVVEHALAAVSYAAGPGGEPVLLTGPAGCGKTLVLRALRRRLPRERYHVAFVTESACSGVSLLRRVAQHLAHTPVPDQMSALETVAAAVRAAEAGGGGAVVMLDDWPRQPAPELLGELRWLLNLDIESGRFCVLLAGEDIVPSRDCPDWLTQRLFTIARLAPLDPDQVADYLEHRLRNAAADTPAGRTSAAHARDVFATDARAEIAQWSRGVPRLVNRIAHLALHVADLEGQSVITRDAVQRAASRLVDTSVSLTPAGELEFCDDVRR